jgi:DNA modification methylase
VIVAGEIRPQDVVDNLIGDQCASKLVQSDYTEINYASPDNSGDDAVRNALYYGDNLEVLRSKIKDESVDLCYIDPPFNSKRTYNQIYTNIGQEDKAQAQAFVDTWVWDDRAKDGYQQIISNHEGRFSSQTIDLITGLRHVLKEGSLLAYLVSMTLRAVEIHRVLKQTGSFFLHCDPTSSHYLKLVLDGIFCSAGGDFLGEIVWRRTASHMTTKRWPRLHDVLLHYCKDASSIVFNPTRVAPDEDWVRREYRHEDERGRYSLDNLTGADTTNGPSGMPWRGVDPKEIGAGRHWRYVPETLDRLDSEGRIYWPKKGKYPKLKQYLAESGGAAVGDVWTDIPVIGRTAAERLGYPTQKPEALLERIIRSASKDGDLVLDAYCGCGTTIAVAQKLNRRWIGMDITYQSISLVLKRLEKDFGKAVVETVNLDGIPKDIESASALAHKKDDRLRKEFEKWAVLTYTDNRAVINDKKGADKGIDGIAYILTDEAEAVRMLLQVKSGNVSRGDVAKLRGDMEREGAKLGTLITLQKPSQPMKQEAKTASSFHNPLTGKSVDRIAIVTIQDIIERGARLTVPVSMEGLWKAKQAKRDDQMALSFVPARKPAAREEVKASRAKVGS